MSQSDLVEIKKLVLQNYASPNPETLPTYALLLKFYINQTQDVEFLQTIWDKFSFDRPSILAICAYARRDSKLVRLGLNLVKEVYDSCPNNQNHLPLESTATQFLLCHMSSNPLIYQMAAQIVRLPLRFQEQRIELIYGLQQNRASNSAELTLDAVKRENEALSKILNAP